MKEVFEWIRRYFVPHLGNNHKPHLFRDHTVFFLMSFIFGLEFLVFTGALFFHQTGYFLSTILPNALVDLTNQERAKLTIPTLSMNPLLAAAAEAKAQDMATKGYFAHTSPEGVTPWYWIAQSGYVFDRAGENLAVNFYGSEDVVNAWMNSPSHKQNILSEGYTEVGIGIATGMYQGRNVIYVAQMFGKPATQRMLEKTNTIALAPATPPRSSRISTLPISPALAIARTIPQASTSVSRASSSVVLAETVERVDRAALAEPSATPHLGFIDRVFLHPDVYLTYVYILAALLIAFPLILSLIIELKRGHLRHILLGSMLFATLLLLVWVNQSGLFSATVLV